MIAAVDDKDDIKSLHAKIKNEVRERDLLGKRKNQLLEDCAKNMENVRLESLVMVNLIKTFDQLSDSERKAEVDSNCQLKSYQLLKSSRGNISWLDRNASGTDLRQAAINKAKEEKVEVEAADIYSKYFVYIIVLDSVKHKKLIEVICHSSNTFTEIAQNIHCACVQVDPSQYAKFFLIGDYLICNLSIASSNSDIQ